MVLGIQLVNCFYWVLLLPLHANYLVQEPAGQVLSGLALEQFQSVMEFRPEFYFGPGEQASYSVRAQPLLLNVSLDLLFPHFVERRELLLPYQFPFSELERLYSWNP